MTQTTFPSLPIVSGETRDGKLYLKYADGSEIEAGTLPDKASLGLGNVENKSPADIIGGMMKGDVTKALGYEPPVEDTQGVNLYTGTKDFSGSDWLGRSENWEDDESTYEGFKVKRTKYRFTNLVQDIGAKKDTSYTFSFFAKASEESKARIYSDNNTGTKETPYELGTEWQKIVYHYTPGSDYSGIFDMPSIQLYEGSAENVTLYVCGFKLERGTVTDPIWTPAPEDVLLKGEVDGRNLLLDSNKHVENSEYSPALYYLAQKPANGETYTFSVKGKFGANKDHLSVYNSGGSVELAKIAFTNGREGVLSATFKWKDTLMDTTVDSSYIVLYVYNQETVETNVIEWVKLEKGSVATDWSPAPEDVSENRNRLGDFKEVYRKFSKNEEIKLKNGSYLLFFAQPGAWNLYGVYFIQKTGYVHNIAEIAKGQQNGEATVSFSEDGSSLVLSTQANVHIILYMVLDFDRRLNG